MKVKIHSSGSKKNLMYHRKKNSYPYKTGNAIFSAKIWK